MTLLVISPDYASHLLPLATLATAWQSAGERVVVASGPATASITAEFGFDRTDLLLGRGSNPGVIRAEQQVTGEDAALRGFFAATELGMVPTLLYQTMARRDDLLWEPVETARRVLAVVDRIQPDRIIVDHLAFSARLALQAGEIPYVTSFSDIPARCRSATRFMDTHPRGPMPSNPIRGTSPCCTRCAVRCEMGSPNSGTPRCGRSTRPPIGPVTRSRSILVWCC
jgi:hypothetical protein